ncbi:unnamed protein product [Aphanomyces euteiches]|uniref:Protein root UVB sensitive/RUS domain-containing protein n=1 Tax=Aphanomyces euteiches TaxID=100861 RepID=A0A6G0WBV7_9STRA|nr:hypothetical protein Ae201684_016626 [Aphanomyces euteiches]KAH9078361.1 hypothetical protein Ae201684P_019451 [Aphanomyces euteiches]KAH9131973.1 hypothetical protein AeRB84_021496 [Aphanomyces euteiches]
MLRAATARRLGVERRALFAAVSRLNHTSKEQIKATQQHGHRELAFRSLPDEKLDLIGSAKPSMTETIKDIPRLLEDLFLPRDYATSTSHDYLPYVKWQFVASVAGSTAGVLSMQSLLYAIGLQSGTIPMAAALNWVIKDGLGQFGGVLFASLVNHRFDADPKRWRAVSAVAMDAATLIEILTPLVPAYFLPMAATANVAKNISWLSASATRAGFHYSFAQRENLADITAKAGSQSIASSIAGTALGIAISPIVGTSTVHVAAAFGVLSCLNLFSIYKSLSVVALRTLNQQRLHLIVDEYWQEDKVLQPTDVNGLEKFVSTIFSGYPNRFQRSTVALSSRLDQVLTPSTIQWPEKYIIHVSPGHVVHLLLEADATSVDVLTAHLHLVKLQMYLEESMEPTQALHQSYADLHSKHSKHSQMSRRDHFINEMLDSEWHCDHLLVEEVEARYKIHDSPSTSAQ